MSGLELTSLACGARTLSERREHDTEDSCPGSAETTPTASGALGAGENSAFAGATEAPDYQDLGMKPLPFIY